jgi:hypothetical protein
VSLGEGSASPGSAAHLCIGSRAPKSPANTNFSESLGVPARESAAKPRCCQSGRLPILAGEVLKSTREEPREVVVEIVT